MNLIRYLLLSIIGYLIIRSFIRYGEEEKHLTDRPKTEKKNKNSAKKVSKGIGEYIDFEDIKK